MDIERLKRVEQDITAMNAARNWIMMLILLRRLEK